MKTCFKCGAEKPVEDFYRHPEMADGRLGKCKECAKLDIRVDRRTKPHVRKYDSERAKLPHRIAQTARLTKRWRDGNPNRVRAQRVAAYAVKGGTLQQPPFCQGCGMPSARLEKHHHDYSKPLAVAWLCKPCHAIADKLRRILEAS